MIESCLWVLHHHCIIHIGHDWMAGNFFGMHLFDVICNALNLNRSWPPKDPCGLGACECWPMADPLLSQAGGLGRAPWMSWMQLLDLQRNDTLKPLGLLLSWLNWRTFMNFHPRNWHFKGRMMKIREFCPGPGSRNSTEIGQPFPTWCTWPCWWRCPSYVGNRSDRL